MQIDQQLYSLKFEPVEVTSIFYVDFYDFSFANSSLDLSSCSSSHNAVIAPTSWFFLSFFLVLN
jgi:hypothetical protein